MQAFITTSIPYVNGPPHIGHALELVQADTIARYHRLTGNATVLQTGTDENAYKNVLAARAQGISVQSLVDRNSQRFCELTQALAIAADTFIRTTEPRHRQGVAAFWRRLRRDDIFKQQYTGLYCTGCEDFILERDLVQGTCPEHLTEPERVEEENYFFRLSSYQAVLEDAIHSGRIAIVPETRKNEVLSFIRRGLQDISVSRDTSRMAGWGIPVPGDSSQTIYVWIDALINYITGQGFGSGEAWRRVWNAETKKVHVIGKNVWKFHAVYWPALLLSAGLPLPDEIVVHGFLTVEGTKISKSLANVIDPFACIDRYGAEAVRYSLLTLSPFGDGDYSRRYLQQRYQADLANGIGNLATRITALCQKAQLNGLELAATQEPPLDFAKHMADHRFDRALRVLWNLATEVNQGIEKGRPWEQIRRAETSQSIQEWVQSLWLIAHWVQPFLPTTGAKLLQSLREPRITRLSPLFPRLEIGRLAEE